MVGVLPVLCCLFLVLVFPPALVLYLPPPTDGSSTNIETDRMW